MYSATPGIALEILVDELLRGAALDAELLREAERAHAVDQPEVDRLDVAALVGRHLGERHAEDVGRSRPVDVGAFVERPARSAGIATTGAP